MFVHCDFRVKKTSDFYSGFSIKFETSSLGKLHMCFVCNGFSTNLEGPFVDYRLGWICKCQLCLAFLLGHHLRKLLVNKGQRTSTKVQVIWPSHSCGIARFLYHRISEGTFISLQRRLHRSRSLGGKNLLKKKLGKLKRMWRIRIHVSLNQKRMKIKVLILF